MNSKLHHRHGPADDDGVLAAGGRRLETGNVPVEDLVGRGLARQSKANQRKQPEHTGRHLGESSRAVSDESLRGGSPDTQQDRDEQEFRRAK